MMPQRGRGSEAMEDSNLETIILSISGLGFGKHWWTSRQ
jgi:hypothetical protein